MSGIGSWVIGLCFAALSVLGLMMAAHGHANTYYWMGLGLFVFGYLMILGLIKANYDQQEN